MGTPLGLGLDAPQLVAYARAADDAGLTDVSVGELRSTEVFALAAAIAGATRSITIETSIVAAVTRSPALIAMGAATLAQLSGGRFRLGLGAGSPMVAGWHESAFTQPLRRVERTLDLVRAALAGERVADLGGFRLAPEMVANVPVVLAAMNEGMLRLAGRKADGVVLQFCGPEQAERMAGIARSARCDAGIAAPFTVTVNVWGAAGLDRANGAPSVPSRGRPLPRRADLPQRGGRPVVGGRGRRRRRGVAHGRSRCRRQRGPRVVGRRFAPRVRRGRRDGPARRVRPRRL